MPQHPDSSTPLAPSTFHMLMALMPGEQHGYGMRKHIETVTSGRIRLRPGSLYWQLKQMVANGWIVTTGRVDGDERERRYYRLTERGRTVAAAEAQRLTELVQFARACNLLPAGA
jgi:DNA-binding PadR family transcriptional regulator